MELEDPRKIYDMGIKNFLRDYLTVNYNDDYTIELPQEAIEKTFGEEICLTQDRDLFKFDRNMLVTGGRTVGVEYEWKR